MEYTLFQLFDGMKRMELKQANDLCIQQKLAGAKNVKAGPNWTKDLYDDKADDDFAKMAKHVRRK